MGTSTMSSQSTRIEILVCDNCKGMGHTKTNCGSLDRRVCLNCFEIGHKASECKSPSKCRKCKQVGHMPSSCDSKSNFNFEVQCLKCYGYGHVQIDCTNVAAVCKRCGMHDHILKDCDVCYKC